MCSRERDDFLLTKLQLSSGILIYKKESTESIKISNNELCRTSFILVAICTITCLHDISTVNKIPIFHRSSTSVEIQSYIARFFNEWPIRKRWRTQHLLIKLSSILILQI